ncbi:hydrogenase maturation nickel metallochaperone HypA [Rhodospirillum rubrum]|uniref:hydrogenase maturation nickel metallochaperone HypA n=1 Tax=Rhodospirillum rubrum TaxID=1085 RepID=UPI001908AA2F|nr:hydrogenase maturation nickel metallochaperone HypA [Rhodospirillum rubrum]MBK1666236.1 hydrogenase maturation nickel metallochaperone HypA [Rhodospirillum rubrum]MBK1678388.1 hydrogenase maturation nickel metallochaperone HypA [Rhodospirillum rubrum]
MHELALAEGVIGVIAQEAGRQGFTRVRLVRLEIGALAAVEPEALTFCFAAVARGTPSEGARLDLVVLPGRGWCLDCGQTITLARRGEACPLCAGYKIQVTGGDDLTIKELEVD